MVPYVYLLQTFYLREIKYAIYTDWCGLHLCCALFIIESLYRLPPSLLSIYKPCCCMLRWEVYVFSVLMDRWLPLHISVIDLSTLFIQRETARGRFSITGLSGAKRRLRSNRLGGLTHTRTRLTLSTCGRQRNSGVHKTTSGGKKTCFGLSK